MTPRALACLLPLALVACATNAPPTVPPTPTATVAPETAAPAAVATVQANPAAAPVVVAPAPVDIAVARAEFARDTAAKYGLDAGTIESVLSRAQIRDAIIAAMSRPAEAKPWRDYRPIFITQSRIDGGRAFLATHREQLARVEAETGVPAAIIVAILGVETGYGTNMGSYPVIDALYTLGFRYPRTGDPAKSVRENSREAFFRDELGQLFALGREANLDVGALQGSYAGAMGWGQFMPSSYRNYAVDGDGDGKRDLINDLDDVFPSVANYFVRKGGWTRGTPVMVPVTRSADAVDFNAESIDVLTTQADLATRGYRPAAIVPPDEMATVIRLDGDAGPEYWMVFRNFVAITKYNTSRLYATAVYQLSQAIAAPAPMIAPPTAPMPMPVSPMSAPIPATPAPPASGQPAT